MPKNNKTQIEMEKIIDFVFNNNLHDEERIVLLEKLVEEFKLSITESQLIVNGFLNMYLTIKNLPTNWDFLVGTNINCMK